MEFQFNNCAEEQLQEILALQEEAFAVLEQPELLRRNSEEMLLECLRPPHITLGAFHGRELAGVSILYFGGRTDENLGIEAGIEGEELDKTANLKLIIVKPKYRGCSLQLKLTAYLEQMAEKQGVRNLCMTVSPLNLHSLRNTEKSGYHRVCSILKYGGLKRELYIKRLNIY